MYVGTDYFPANQTEDYLIGFDFSLDLPSGDGISGASWSVANASDTQVTDPSPSGRLIAGPFVSSTTVTTARFSGFLPNVKYLITATVTTTLSNTLVLYSHVQGDSPF